MSVYPYRRYHLYRRRRYFYRLYHVDNIPKKQPELTESVYIQPLIRLLYNESSSNIAIPYNRSG
jgi:hypothetical protein